MPNSIQDIENDASNGTDPPYLADDYWLNQHGAIADIYNSNLNESKYNLDDCQQEEYIVIEEYCELEDNEEYDEFNKNGESSENGESEENLITGSETDLEGNNTITDSSVKEMIRGILKSGLNFTNTNANIINGTGVLNLVDNES